MLKYRLITTFTLIPMVIGALFFLSFIGFAMIIFAVCVVSAWEWGHLSGLVSNNQRIWMVLFCSLLIALMVFTLSTYQSFATIWQTQYTLLVAIAWWLVALLLVLCYPNSAIFWREFRLLRLIFGILTILPFFWCMLVLRQYYYNSNHLTGSWWILCVMIIVWCVDSGAYISGRMFGRHKLAPKISPSKTWEGLIGGLIASIIIILAFCKYAPINAAPFTLLICSIITAMASVLGDLTESMFKREAGIKDSSHLIPGHGGILDRIDSLTAAVPVFTYLILLVFNVN